jgi:hypothetical protein
MAVNSESKVGTVTASVTMPQLQFLMDQAETAGSMSAAVRKTLEAGMLHLTKCPKEETEAE